MVRSSAQCDEGYDVGGETDQHCPGGFFRPQFNVVSEFAPSALRTGCKFAIFVRSQPTALATRDHANIPSPAISTRSCRMRVQPQEGQCNCQSLDVELKKTTTRRQLRSVPSVGRQRNRTLTVNFS